MGKIKNSPLIEAIFEIRWGEKQQGQLEFRSEEVDFFPGIFSQAVRNEGFKFSEQVNNAPGKPTLPFEVRHRFRKEMNKWPCFQIGLGIFTVNQIGNLSLQAAENDEYDWDDFKPVIEIGLNALDRSYPSGISNLICPHAILRYQDAFKLGQGETIESFVSEKIKADIQIANVFTDQPNISSNAKDIRLDFTYETTRPVGQITISVINGLMNGENCVVIDTTVNSPIKGDNVSLESLINWCEEAHDLQRHTFETLIRTSDLEG